MHWSNIALALTDLVRIAQHGPLITGQAQATFMRLVLNITSICKRASCRFEVEARAFHSQKEASLCLMKPSKMTLVEGTLI